MPIIEARQLRKVYGNGKVALDGLSFEVRRGEVFGFLGPNGAGKTTAVKILTGLVAPTAGEARVFGLPPGDPAAKARLGFLPEHFRFYDWLTGWELLDFYGRLSGLEAGRRRRRIQEALELTGLADAADARLHAYSKGMQQRIGIAQALLHEPELVLLDEPTSALDPLGRREVRDLIRRLKAEGATLFLNSHLLSEVEMVCDRVAIVDHGRVIRAGLMAELLDGSRELRVMVDRVTPELRARLQKIGSVQQAGSTEVVLAVADPDAAPLAAEAVHSLGLRLYGLVPAQRRLEDIFVQAVEGEAQ
ncbi:MAG: ABC transporter ATP-binding protein [Bacteroidetes bacterium]|nr:ABC transporter ATP-binding protein [Bacteroidota bacterium]MCL5025376.1 ABC transporter ATP-binding protein [Chloroflexota bacterium]